MSPSTMREASAPGEAGRVLVADDQPDVLEALRLLLKLRGFAVRMVSSPAAVLEAIREAGRKPYDLLVMDLNYARDTTSGREGLELAARVRELDPHLPIVVMTAWSTVPLAVAIMREGVSDFVEKPWDNRRLVTTAEAQVAAGRRLRRADRLETDATAVQRRLLVPTPPVVAGFDVGLAWEFAERLGGDAFEVVPLDGGRIAVAIADVCGKGTPAALLISSAQATLQDLMARGLPPREICERLGRALAPRLEPSRFVSLVVAELDPAGGCLRYVNAGHPPPLLLRADGTVARLDAGGPVIGVIAEAGYDQDQLALRPGDRLVLFTDGIVEATLAGDELGEARVAAHLSGTRSTAASRAAELLLEHARSLAGGHLSDDASVLVVDVQADLTVPT